MKIMLTIDVEDYIQVSALSKSRNIKDRGSKAFRVVANMHHLLGLFDKHNVKSAHFNLGWKVKVSWFSKFRHYNNSDKGITNLDIFLSNFSPTTVQDKFYELELIRSSHDVEVDY